MQHGIKTHELKVRWEEYGRLSKDLTMVLILRWLWGAHACRVSLSPRDCALRWCVWIYLQWAVTQSLDGQSRQHIGMPLKKKEEGHGGGGSKRCHSRFSLVSNMPINFKADGKKRREEEKKLCLSQSKPELSAKQANASFRWKERKKCDQCWMDFSSANTI